MKGFLRRRLPAFVLGCLPLLALSAAALVLVPEKYRSAATLRGNPGSREAARDPNAWLSAAAAEVLTSPALAAIADRYRLFPELQGATAPARSERFRRSLEMQVIPAQAGSPEASVTFSVGFTGGEPTTTWGVARDVSHLFVAHQARQPVPSPATAPDPIDLHHREVERLDAQLRDLEGRLASLQRTRAAGLGEDIDPALQRVEALTREAARAEARLRAGRQRRAELESQLSSVPPTVPARQEAQPEETAAGPDRAGPNRQKLQELKTKLTALQRILGAAHPQVAELTRQIDTLEATTAPPPRPARREQPPSVANPALAALREQIASLDAELARDEADRAAALSKLSYEKERLRTSSRVAEEHAALSRARDELRRRREEMAARWVQVRPAEKETPAPGFVLVEAARLPDSPEGLGRRPIALAGAALSLLGGMLSAGLRGRRLRPVASPERAQELTGLPVLGVVPLVRAPRELEGG